MSSAGDATTGTSTLPTFRRRLAAQFRSPLRWVMAALLLLVVAVGLWAWRAAGQVLPVDPGGSWAVLLPNLVVALLAGVLIATVIALVAAVLRKRTPWIFLVCWFASAALLATMGAAGAVRGWWLIVAGVLVAIPLVGLTVGAALSRADRPGRRLLAVGLVSGLVLALAAGWLAWPGPRGADAVVVTPTVAGGTTAQAPTDPTAAGEFEVATLRYGATGTNAEVETTGVDASPLIRNWAPALTSAWGFDPTDLPLNARVWYPRGEGPFPLVLVLHGNATAGKSEEGYAYLGETLATRGYVVASIDENFLNTGVLGDRTEGLDPARAWLVLEHLRQWKAWSSGTSGGPLTGLARTQDISLVGHSRGGEAVTTAAALNSRSSWPEAPGLRMDHGHDISTVIGIAPSDGVYKPAGTPTELDGISYFALAGSYDADVFSFAGARQYARVTPGPGNVRAALALDRANHTQFNSLWGRHDAALGVAKYVLATGPLMSPADQRRAALGYVSAFLDLTIKRQTANAAYFDGSLSTAPFAAVGVRNQFARGEATPLSAGDTAGGEASLVKLPTRVGESDNEVRRLSGMGEVTQSYRLPRQGVPWSGIALDIADTDTARTEISLELTDGSGKTATLQLGAEGVAPPPLPGRFTKAGFLMPSASQEPALATFTIPRAAVVQTGMSPDLLTQVKVVAKDPGPQGVFVDNVLVSR